MHSQTHPVLVVGAGPVGLTMACELARHGVRCRIVDQQPHATKYCRAIGITPRTLEIWDDMGIVHQMIDSGLWLTGMRLVVGGAEPKDLLRDFSDLPYGSFGLPQYETERILGEHLATFGIPIERPVTLTSLEQEDDRIRVLLQDPNSGREEARFRYVVGCDGAHSMVRRSLGIPFEGDRFLMEFMLGDVEIDWSLPRGLSLRAIQPRDGQAPDLFVAIPLPEPNRYRVTMIAPNGSNPSPATTSTDHGIQAERPGPDLPQLQEVADRIVPGRPRLSNLRWSSIFRISMRLAQRYRAGNAFLAGDAAHIHPPTGGQGMNTGIQDAYNLAWKLALVLNGRASESLLATYEKERLPVGADVVARTTAASERIGRSEAQQDRLADTQILIHYRSSPLTKEDLAGDPPFASPRAGDRAPDCGGFRRENVLSPLRLFDTLRGTSFVLLVYHPGPLAPDEINILETLAATLRNASGPAANVVLITGPGDAYPSVFGVRVLRDAENVFATTYAATSGTCYLVRPDGYIAYHARPFTPEGVLQYLNEIGLWSSVRNT